MSNLPGRRTVQAAIACCLLMLQGNLLGLATIHLHFLMELAGGSTPAIHSGSLQPRPALASELSCGLCQMVRQSLALPVTASPTLYFAPLVSRSLLFRGGDYESCQSIVPQGRAPPLS